MDLSTKIQNAVDKRRHCEGLLSAYDLVLEDLADWEDDEWKFVRKRVAWMRGDIAGEIEELQQSIAAMRSQCDHAFERVGEARPPYRRCVRCNHTEQP